MAKIDEKFNKMSKECANKMAGYTPPKKKAKTKKVKRG